MNTFRIFYRNPENDERGHVDMRASFPQVARNHFYASPDHAGFHILKVKRVKA